MKSWFVSSLLLFAPSARADAEALATCLDRSDIVCAEEAARDLGTDPLSTAMRGRLAYYQADFPTAVKLMEAAQPKLKDQVGAKVWLVAKGAGDKVQVSRFAILRPGHPAEPEAKP